MKLFIVTILPVKSSKDNYVLGVFSGFENATAAAKKEISKPDASWWIEYKITATHLDQPSEDDLTYSL